MLSKHSTLSLDFRVAIHLQQAKVYFILFLAAQSQHNDHQSETFGNLGLDLGPTVKFAQHALFNRKCQIRIGFRLRAA